MVCRADAYLPLVAHQVDGTEHRFSGTKTVTPSLIFLLHHAVWAQEDIYATQK